MTLSDLQSQFTRSLLHFCTSVQQVITAAADEGENFKTKCRFSPCLLSFILCDFKLTNRHTSK